VSKVASYTPKWWKNTFFWIAAVLFIIGVLGLPFLGGDQAIRDPGQTPESNLYFVYFGACIITLINGLISHKLTVQQYLESIGDQ
jgi:hypothetical protein